MLAVRSAKVKTGSVPGFNKEMTAECDGWWNKVLIRKPLTETLKTRSSNHLHLIIVFSFNVVLSDNRYQMASQLEYVTWNQMNTLTSTMKRWDSFYFFISYCIFFQLHLCQSFDQDLWGSKGKEEVYSNQMTVAYSKNRARRVSMFLVAFTVYFKLWSVLP